jgi:26S proteasome regulatory subunit N7
MAPFYKEVCSELKWDLDEGLVASLQQACDEKVKALDAKIEEAEKSLGETEIREAMLEKSEHFATIGDKVRIRAQHGHTLS